MSVKMRKHTERAQRVDLFMDGSLGDFPVNSKGRTLAASFKEELSKLAELAVARSSGTSKRRQGTVGRQDARTMLRELVESVSATSKSAAHERPEIKGVFDITGKDRSDGTLGATARAFADAAPPFAAVMVEYGLPSSFVEDLRAGADKLEQNISLQEEGKGAGASTTASVDETLQRLADLTERLDPIIRNRYREDPVKLAAWERARRLEIGTYPKGGGNTAPPTKNES